MPDIRHDPDASRFAADVDGGTAELEYKRTEGVIAFVHTFVPKAARGQGVAEALVTTGLAFAREHGLRVVPVCPYVTHYIETHPEAQDLVG